MGTPTFKTLPTLFQHYAKTIREKRIKKVSPNIQIVILTCGTINNVIAAIYIKKKHFLAYGSICSVNEEI